MKVRTDRSSHSSTSADGAHDLRSGTVVCRVVGDRAELDLHLRIRDEVFVREQGIFEGTDRDAHDDEATTLHVIGLRGTEVGGAVRLYPLDEPGLWKGDRLAVLPDFRRSGLGAPLVRFAVATAGQLGGDLMIAHIQPENVRFFEYLGWERAGDPEDYAGRPHQRMRIGLTRGAPDR